MKPRLYLLLIALAPLLFSQCCKDDPEILKCWVEVDGTYEYISITKAPEYIDGCQDGFDKAVADEIKYPVEARENGIQGEVIVEYEITKAGTVENAVIIEEIGAGCGEETKRTLLAVTEGESFKPAEINGEPVRVKKEFTIVFRLE